MSRQFLIPGQGYFNESGLRSYIIPGWGFVNENEILTSAGLVEGSDVIAGSVTQTSGVASGALQESSDVISSSVTQAGGNSSGDLLESSDIISATVAAAITSTAGLQESSDVIAAAVSSATQGRDFLIPGMGYFNDKNYNDFIVPGWGYVIGTVLPNISSTAGLQESSDVIAAFVAIANARGNLIESSDIIGGAVTAITIAGGALQESSDIIAAVVSQLPMVNGALFESSDIIGAAVGQLMRITGALFEQSDVIDCFVASNNPTPASRTLKAYPAIVDFIYYGCDSTAVKTPSEVLIYSLTYDPAIGSDQLATSGWESFNGDLILSTQTISGNTAFCYVGGGVLGTTSPLINLVDTVGLRQIEASVQIQLQEYNFATNKTINGGVSDILDYAIDWSARIMDPAETITTSVWNYDGDDTALNIGYYPPFIFGDNIKTGVWLNAGTLNANYILNNTVTTSLGRILQSSFIYSPNQPIVVINPENDYTTEDGSQPYGTESGSENYGY